MQESWFVVSFMETTLYQCKVIMLKIKCGRLNVIGNRGFRFWLLSNSTFLSRIGKFKAFFLFAVNVKYV